MTLDDNNTNISAERAAEKKAARLAAYLEEYGAEEAEVSRELFRVSVFAGVICVICGVVSIIPWHPVIAWALGICVWVFGRSDLREKQATAQKRRKLYGLD